MIILEKSKNKKGFALVEIIVGVAVFAVICVSVYSAYSSIFNVIYTSRAKLDAVDLINEQLELVRNLPYSDVGIYGSLLPGKLTHEQTLIRGGNSFLVTTTIQNYDDPFDGTATGTPHDSAPADFKLVEIQIDCAECKNYKPISITTRVAPKNLEAASTNGSLFIKVFDANGIAIQDADVHVVYDIVNPAIVTDDTTDKYGMLQIIDVPPGVNAYNITVSKPGYSSDQTYKATVSNPDPTKPPATVVAQQVTQISFTIDKLSTFAVSSVSLICAPVVGVDFNLKGQKIVGNPSLLKYNHDYATNSGGLLSLTNMEWDSYVFTLTDSAYQLIGMSPISPTSLLPGSTQAVQMIVASKNPRAVLFTVKDSVTGLPLSGVDVAISGHGENTTKTTGQGYLNQTDWRSGGGQATSTDVTKYFATDGNIEDEDPEGDLVLKKVFSDYVSSGWIESSSFDIGSASNFQKILWTPIDQPVDTGIPNVRLQIATNNDGGTWDYKGPDGTASTYYTVGNQNISSVNDNKRYFRYKVFLDTATTTLSPNVSDVSFTFTTDCTPPGQVLFDDLSDNDYDFHFTKSGYADQDLHLNINSSWQNTEVVMLPS